MKGLINLEENYYDILQVNKNASIEIIEKAYKTLVKKYHPDLQENNIKKECEEKIKKINEAYEVLSNSEKRKSYDLTLSHQNIISEEEYNKLYSEYINMKNELNYLKNNINNTVHNNITNNSLENNSDFSQGANTEHFTDSVNDAINKAYYDAYIQDLKNRGYKIKYKKTKKDYIAMLITFFIIVFLSFLLWHIPFVRKYLVGLYKKNSALKFLVDSILNLFS